MTKIITTIIALFAFTSCSVQDDSIGIIGGADGPTSIIISNESGNEENKMITYEIISQDKAKEIMDSETEHIILDVREENEFDEGHIPGAILIPHEEINNKAPTLLPDKDALILVYCRSGRRSKIASQALADLGYTNIKEFGGIIDWKYEIVK